MSLFRFAKQGFLRDVFPNSAAGGNLTVNELDSTVYLTHPAVGGGGVLDSVLSFLITGTAGVANVDGSEIPKGRVFYMPFLVVFHNDGAAARRVRIYVRHVATARFVTIHDSSLDFLTTIPADTGYPLRRPIYVPPGWAIGAEVFAIGGAAQGFIQGGGALLSIADHPPALF